MIVKWPLHLSDASHVMAGTHSVHASRTQPQLRYRGLAAIVRVTGPSFSTVTSVSRDP
jgi:hypothetical protein